MGLTSSLQIGRSGLLTSQAALQVAGNNLANLTTEGYHRTDAKITAVRAHEIRNGVFIGQGVQLTAITRQVDEALEARLRGAVSDQSGSRVTQDLFSEIEAIENELSEVDVSTRLATFFNAWSELANNPQDLSLRTLVVEEATTLTDFIQSVRGEFGQMQKRIDDRLGNAVDNVNDLLDRIVELNRSIALQEGGTSGEATGLRDQRDLYLTELSEYIDFTTVEQNGGGIDIFIGSLPIVLGTQNRGLIAESQAVDGQITTAVRIAADNSPVDIQSGELGALIRFRGNHLEDAIDTLNTFSNTLIYEVNKIHSTGQGLNLYDGIEGTNIVVDTTAALNTTAAGIAFTPNHGSFQFHVTQRSTGQRMTQTIQVDLDGINPATDTSLTSLAADLNAVANVSATITPDGRLSITPDSGDFQISFSDDSSGALAALGVGAFFTGSDSFDIEVNTGLVGDPRLVAAAQGHLPGDNRNALALSGLRDQGIASLEGLSVTGYWNRHVEDVSIRTAQARDQFQADSVVKENLQVQQQAFSGVNADEETIDLMSYQRMYQANARFISVVDELMQTLLTLV
ncbi:MAG: flagellar hook-associated protein FlgK [Planctomycetota bacterium]